jgi:hypothetical protein
LICFSCADNVILWHSTKVFNPCLFKKIGLEEWAKSKVRSMTSLGKWTYRVILRCPFALGKVMYKAAVFAMDKGRYMSDKSWRLHKGPDRIFFVLLSGLGE